MKWISVGERLPEPVSSWAMTNPVLIWDEQSHYGPRLGEYSHKSQTWYHHPLGYPLSVTHWMPLPRPPSEELDDARGIPSDQVSED